MRKKFRFLLTLSIVVMLGAGLGGVLLAADDNSDSSTTTAVADNSGSSIETNLEALVANKILKKLEPLNQIKKVKIAAVKSSRKQERFFIFAGGLFGFITWVILILNIVGAAIILIKVLDHIHKGRILPKKLIDTVRAHLAEGELGFAISSCNESDVPLARILLAAFKYIEDGFDAAKDAMHIAVKTEEEKLWKPIKYLLPCGAIAFTVGLCGSFIMIISLLKDYAANSTVGAGQLLAFSVAQGLYPLILGTIIACVIFLFYVYASIKASRIAVNTEMLAFDIIKVLRGAELVDDDFPKIGTMTQLIQ